MKTNSLPIQQRTGRTERLIGRSTQAFPKDNNPRRTHPGPPRLRSISRRRKKPFSHPYQHPSLDTLKPTTIYPHLETLFFQNNRGRDTGVSKDEISEKYANKIIGRKVYSEPLPRSLIRPKSCHPTNPMIRYSGLNGRPQRLRSKPQRSVRFVSTKLDHQSYDPFEEGMMFKMSPLVYNHLEDQDSIKLRVIEVDESSEGETEEEEFRSQTELEPIDIPKVVHQFDKDWLLSKPIIVPPSIQIYWNSLQSSSLWSS